MIRNMLIYERGEFHNFDGRGEESTVLMKRSLKFYVLVPIPPVCTVFIYEYYTFYNPEICVLCVCLCENLLEYLFF